MSTWIRVPEDGVITVQNGYSQPVRVVVQKALHPTIEYEGNCVYPVEWKGFVHVNGTSEHWEYPTSPVRQIRVRTDNDGTRWILVVWK